MSNILITGGTGTIGKRLTQLLLAKGHTITILSRKHPVTISSAGIQYALWDVDKGMIDVESVCKADYIVHLAGAGVAEKRWNSARKKEILDSRTQSSALLVQTLRDNPHAVKAVISASAIGWYGSDTDASKQQGFTEDAVPETDFLGNTCKLWEESIDPITQMGIRLVKLRTGIVLSNEGGAYIEFKKPLRWGIAGIIGGGHQIVSWIHEEDICRMYMHAIEQAAVSGVYNAVAPLPVSNKKLTLELATQLRGKFFTPIHVPSFVLKIVLGELSIEVLKSTTVSASKIKATGFQFLYPTIEAAIQALVKEERG